MLGIVFYNGPPSGDRRYTFVTIITASGETEDYVTSGPKLERETILRVAAFARHFGFSSFVDRVSDRGSVPVSLYPVDQNAEDYVKNSVEQRRLDLSISMGHAPVKSGSPL
jgi:hypothetical protein